MDGSQIIEASEAKEVTGLERLRMPFSGDDISKKPVPMAWMTNEMKDPAKKGSVGINCTICGGWHHRKADHLDYVGHAAITNRLLDADIAWNWEPVATNEDGTPKMQNGGMWIKLTVCGVTRLGFGDADGKTGGNATKEAIGDALRNAAMRFGAALALWHKGDLHASNNDHTDEPAAAPAAPKEDRTPPPETRAPVNDDVKAKAGRLKDLIDQISHAPACNVDAFAKAHDADWSALPEPTREFLASRIRHRAGTLSQAPAKDDADLTEAPF